MKRLLACLMILALLTSCGGGGGSNSISTFETPTYSATYSTAQLSSLYYETSPSGLTGTLSKGERFSFKAGDVVSFYVSETNRFLVAKSPTLPMSFTDLNSQNVELEKALLSAYYNDAPVKGLIYENSLSSYKGVTDEKGRFDFFAGDATLFYIDPINRIYLGKVNPKHDEYIIPSIDTVYDSEVDSVGINLLLFTFEKLVAGSNYMDLSGLMLNSETANKIKRLLARQQIIDLSGELSQLIQSVQNYIPNYTYKNSGVNITYLDYFNNSMRSLELMRNLPIELNDYHGSFVYDWAGTSNVYLNFQSGGRVSATYRDGDLSTGFFNINGSSITIRWDQQSNKLCDLSLGLKKRGLQWSLMSSKNADTPLGCDPNISIVERPYRVAKLSSAMSISKISGKQLKIPSKAVCGLGDGDVIFNTSLSGISNDQRFVSIPASVCTDNMPIEATVRETGIPGVLIFDFDSVRPKAKFIFSVLEVSGRAATQLSYEDEDEIGRYGNSNSIETNFSLH